MCLSSRVDLLGQESREPTAKPARGIRRLLGGLAGLFLGREIRASACECDANRIALFGGEQLRRDQSFRCPKGGVYDEGTD